MREGKCVRACVWVGISTIERERERERKRVSEFLGKALLYMMISTPARVSQSPPGAAASAATSASTSMSVSASSLASKASRQLCRRSNQERARMCEREKEKENLCLCVMCMSMCVFVCVCRCVCVCVCVCERERMRERLREKDWGRKPSRKKFLTCRNAISCFLQLKKS